MLQGSPSAAVQWGAWAAVGMAAADGALVQRLVRQGYGALSPRQGLAVLAHAVSSRAQPPVSAASPFNFATFLAGDSRWHVCPLQSLGLLPVGRCQHLKLLKAQAMCSAVSSAPHLQGKECQCPH